MSYRLLWSVFLQSETYYFSLGLMLVSLFCSAVVALGFLLRLCCADKGRSYLMGVLSLFGLCTTFAAAAYFATHLPDAIRQDLGGQCPSDRVRLLADF